MANPQPTDPHLRVAHSINEAIMTRDFTKRRRKILDLILRLSWGCGKKDALIPRQQDFEFVGVGKGHIKIELDWLEVSRVIYRDGPLYWFNKNFDDWQVSRVSPFSPNKVTDLVTLNLHEKKPEVTETVTDKLPKREQSGYRNSNLPTPELATPKERVKKVKESIYIVPDWIDKNTWEAFMETRKKSPPTEHAKDLLVKELGKLKVAGNDPNEVLNQSIMNNWKGVFPLKGGSGGTHKGGSRQLRPRESYTKPGDYHSGS